jgi:hypothetical protein
MPITEIAVCAVAGMARSLSWRPWPAYRWRGQEHGRTIPLADLAHPDNLLTDTLHLCILNDGPGWREIHAFLSMEAARIHHAARRAAAWPVAAQVEYAERVRRIGCAQDMQSN